MVENKGVVLLFIIISLVLCFCHVMYIGFTSSLVMFLERNLTSVLSYLVNDNHEIKKAIDKLCT